MPKMAKNFHDTKMILLDTKTKRLWLLAEKIKQRVPRKKLYFMDWFFLPTGAKADPTGANADLLFRLLCRLFRHFKAEIGPLRKFAEFEGCDISWPEDK